MKDAAKRRTAAVLILVLLMTALAGCGDDTEPTQEQTQAQTTQATTTTQVTQATPTTQGVGGQQAAAAGQREYRVQPRGGGEDVVTLMLYLCGSDLESEGGAATIDLEEIMAAPISENLNIVVETGGASEWASDMVDADANQRWVITESGMAQVDQVEMRDMSEGETLSDFIAFAAENYPADRYMLVLWDHGGGTVGGYAYDERFDGGGMMPISELNRALSDASVVFDMIGFDCCLMSTAETAFMVEKYADYMVASQRVEPGDGWHYTPWITVLSQDTSIPTPELGKVIVDSFIEECSGGYYGEELTLSLTDLTYIPELFENMYVFFDVARESLVSDSGFISTSQTLGGSRAISDNDDLVDLAYLISSMDGADELLQSLDRCIAYNVATIDDYNGLCLYFPYTELDKVEDALDIYGQIGIDDTYQDFITTFANVMVGGQAHGGGGTGNPVGGDDFDLDYWLEFEWVDELLFGEFEDFYEENSYDGSELAIDEKDGGYVLSLPRSDWEIITTIEQRVFLDDGEGYIDLGSDSMYEFDGDGDLLINFDNNWVALNGELVCFYTAAEVTQGDEWYTYGVVPVMYDGQAAEILVMWDDENPDGYVPGWRYITAGSSSQKGLFKFTGGMTFDLLCDYYTYDREYDDQYVLGSLTVNGPIKVSYEDVGEADCMVYYVLYDIYRNAYWTEAVEYSMDN